MVYLYHGAREKRGSIKGFERAAFLMRTGRRGQRWIFDYERVYARLADLVFMMSAIKVSVNHHITFQKSPDVLASGLFHWIFY